MLTPILLQLIFWLGVLGCIGAGVYVILDDQAAKQLVGDRLPAWVTGESKLFVGLALIIGGPIVLRIYFELLLLPFSMNSTLTDIRRGLIKAEQERRGGGETSTAHTAPIDPGARLRR
jgi:hypothetical protein